MNQTQSSYDLVAAEYAAHFGEELEKKPFDRKMLDWLLEKVGTAGTICDLGCGPGQIAAYLDRRGSTVCGIDLSPEMVRQAQRLNPAIPFHQGNLLALDEVAENSFAGMAAFYCIIHIAPASVSAALREMQRVLRPGGKLLLTFHIGNEVRHLEEWWDKKVALDFFFFQTAEMKGWLELAGFRLEEVIERDPYPDLEVQTRRAYLFASKP